MATTIPSAFQKLKENFSLLDT